MDPDANLNEQLDIARKVFSNEEAVYDLLPCGHRVGLQDAGERLAELVLALDEWLHSGGFRPRRWQRG